MRGKVKWFNDKMGYGFIESKEVKNDIFIHFTNINKNGYKILYEGDLVKFDYDKDKNKAINLIIIKKACKCN